MVSSRFANKWEFPAFYLATCLLPLAPGLGAETDSAPAEPELRVLFIGDSIAGSTSEAYVGYSHHIAELRPNWHIDRLGVSTSRDLLNKLERAGEDLNDFDVIYVNSGLHSIRQDRFEELDVYRENLDAALALLAGLEGPRIIWRTTTPTAAQASGGRDGSLVPVYNEVSVELAIRHGLEIDDLYAALMPYYSNDPQRGGRYLVPDGTHWSTSAQKELIAPHIVEVILRTPGEPETEQ